MHLFALLPAGWHGPGINPVTIAVYSSRALRAYLSRPLLVPLWLRRPQLAVVASKDFFRYYHSPTHACSSCFPYNPHECMLKQFIYEEHTNDAVPAIYLQSASQLSVQSNTCTAQALLSCHAQSNLDDGYTFKPVRYCGLGIFLPIQTSIIGMLQLFRV